MSKKILAGFLVLALMVGALVGCAQTPTSTTPAGTTTKAGTTPVGTTAAPTTAAPTTAGTTAAPKATMRFATGSLTSDQTGAVTKSLIAVFKKNNPNVTLNIEEYQGNDLIPAINTAIAADNCPDVFTFWRPESGWNVPAYVKAGAIADLTALSQTPAFKDTFPEFAMRTAKQIDGIVYCIPQRSYYDVFLVNKVVFDKFKIPLPTTWDALVSACAALKANGIIPWTNTTGALLDDSSRHLNNILNRVVGNTKALKLMGGTASWLDADVMPALQAFVAICANNGPPDQSALSQTQAISKYLNTGAAAMMLDNNGGNTNIPATAQANLIAMEFPILPGGVEKTSSTEADVTTLCYASAKSYKDTNKKGYIDALITTLCDKTAAKAYVEQANVLVPHLGLTIDQSFITPLVLQANAIAEKQIGNKWLLSFVSADNRSSFRDAINEVWYGKMNAQQLADALQKGLYGKTN